MLSFTVTLPVFDKLSMLLTLMPPTMVNLPPITLLPTMLSTWLAPVVRLICGRLEFL